MPAASAASPARRGGANATGPRRPRSRRSCSTARRSSSASTSTTAPLGALRPARVHAAVGRLEQLGGRPVDRRRQGAARDRPAPPAAEPVDLLSDAPHRERQGDRRRPRRDVPGHPRRDPRQQRPPRVGGDGQRARRQRRLPRDDRAVRRRQLRRVQRPAGADDDVHRAHPDRRARHDHGVGRCDVRGRPAPRPDHPGDREPQGRAAHGRRRR